MAQKNGTIAMHRFISAFACETEGIVVVSASQVLLFVF